VVLTPNPNNPNTSIPVAIQPPPKTDNPKMYVEGEKPGTFREIKPPAPPSPSPTQTPNPTPSPTPNERPPKVNIYTPTGGARTRTMGNFTPITITFKREEYSCKIPDSDPDTSGNSSTPVQGRTYLGRAPTSKQLVDIAPSVYVPRDDAFSPISTCTVLKAMRQFRNTSSVRYARLPAFLPNNRLGSFQPLRLGFLDLCDHRAMPPPPRARGSSYWNTISTLSYVPGLVESTYQGTRTVSKTAALVPGRIMGNWGSSTPRDDMFILVPGTTASNVIPIPLAQAASSDFTCKPKAGGSTGVINGPAADEDTEASISVDSSNSTRQEEDCGQVVLVPGPRDTYIPVAVPSIKGTATDALPRDAACVEACATCDNELAYYLGYQAGTFVAVRRDAILYLMELSGYGAARVVTPSGVGVSMDSLTGSGSAAGLVPFLGTAGARMSNRYRCTRAGRPQYVECEPLMEFPTVPAIVYVHTQEGGCDQPPSFTPVCTKAWLQAYRPRVKSAALPITERPGAPQRPPRAVVTDREVVPGDITGPPAVPGAIPLLTAPPGVPPGVVVTSPAPQPGVSSPAPQPGATSPASQPGTTSPAPQPGVIGPQPVPSPLPTTFLFFQPPATFTYQGLVPQQQRPPPGVPQQPAAQGMSAAAGCRLAPCHWYIPGFNDEQHRALVYVCDQPTKPAWNAVDVKAGITESCARQPPTQLPPVTALAGATPAPAPSNCGLADCQVYIPGFNDESHKAQVWVCATPVVPQGSQAVVVQSTCGTGQATGAAQQHNTQLVPGHVSDSAKTVPGKLNGTADTVSDVLIIDIEDSADDLE
jgi:hypothetical protein